VRDAGAHLAANTTHDSLTQHASNVNRQEIDWSYHLPRPPLGVLACMYVCDVRLPSAPREPEVGEPDVRAVHNNINVHLIQNV